MKKQRLDLLLIRRGLCEDADDALRKVLAREVKIDTRFATSVAERIYEDAKIEVVSRNKYVSRGGQKLAHAIDVFNLDVSQDRCLDIGSSTGGFADCLLQAGAKSVACVDVNYGQLDWKLRSNKRVSVFERTNIKYADPLLIGAPFDMIVIDVSFIGLASLVSKIKEFCYDKKSEKFTNLVALIKPQFEAKKEEVVGGFVKSEEVRQRTVEEVKSALETHGFQLQGTTISPITGATKHNVEYLIYAIY